MIGDELFRLYTLNELIRQAETLFNTAVNTDDRDEAIAALDDVRLIRKECEYRVANNIWVRR